MKSRTLIVIISSAVLVALITGGILFLHVRERVVLRSPMLSQEPTIITYMEGVVETIPDFSPDAHWVSAEIGMRLKEGARIRTASDSLADIRIYDEGAIRLLGNTEVTLTDLTIRRQTMDIARGTLFAKFRLLFDSQQLRFTTPDAVASVRGTELVFLVDGSGTRIDALSGITEVSNPLFPAERILLAFQNSTAVESGAPPSEPVDMTPRMVMDHRRNFNGINYEEVFLISQDILFVANSAEILQDSLDELDEVARLLKLRRVDILIAGHTADVGGTAGQVRLSEERAEGIRNQLITRGIPARRLSTVGYGGSRPVGDNNTQEGRAANRRVEFLVVE